MGSKNMLLPNKLKKCTLYIANNQYLLSIILVSINILCIFIRFKGINFESNDYKGWLSIWWNIIATNGTDSLRNQVGNYNIPYQIIILLLTKLSITSLYAYKLVSIIFDFVLAISAGILVRDCVTYYKNQRFWVVFTLTFCAATTILNSSFWGQCDSIYTSFIILSLYFLRKNKNLFSYILLGIAFSFKLQTVFIFPFYFYYHFSKDQNKFALTNFLVIPIVDIILCLPAFIMGRNISDLFMIYLGQTEESNVLTQNIPNVWWIFTDSKYESTCKIIALVITFLLLGIMLLCVLIMNTNLYKPEKFFIVAIWTVFTTVMFLPGMHERYAYLLDILTLVLAIIDFKKIPVLIICYFISLRGYLIYLFNINILDTKICVLIYMITYLWVTYLVLKNVLELKSLKNIKINSTKS